MDTTTDHFTPLALRVRGKDKPQLLADRNINPKISDVYNISNKWRKDNLGIRTGKELFVTGSGKTGHLAQ